MLLQGAEGAIVLLIGIAFIVAHFVLIAWTYSDAQNRSDHPPVLWALVVFFAPLLGILLYFIIGRNSY
ncbi:hypothetical protein DM2_2077 [Halorubrum sp. DM2]|nr:hypothetical protein DM2_2077 [Halorubrum sp. DM2]